MIFYHKQRNFEKPIRQLKLNEYVIERVTDFNLFGLTIDQHLTLNGPVQNYPTSYKDHSRLCVQIETYNWKHSCSLIQCFYFLFFIYKLYTKCYIQNYNESYLVVLLYLPKLKKGPHNLELIWQTEIFIHLSFITHEKYTVLAVLSLFVYCHNCYIVIIIIITILSSLLLLLLILLS